MKLDTKLPKALKGRAPAFDLKCSFRKELGQEVRPVVPVLLIFKKIIFLIFRRDLVSGLLTVTGLGMTGATVLLDCYQWQC